MKRIVMTAHARLRSSERKISSEWIDRTTRDAAWTEPDPIDPEVERRFRPIPEAGGRILRVALRGDGRRHTSYKRDVRQNREDPAMKNLTYDPSADAAYIPLGHGEVVETEEVAAGVVIDYDAQRRIIGIELLSASKTLAPGDWIHAGPPRAAHADAAE